MSGVFGLQLCGLKGLGSWRRNPFKKKCVIYGFSVFNPFSHSHLLQNKPFSLKMWKGITHNYSRCILKSLMGGSIRMHWPRAAVILGYSVTWAQVALKNLHTAGLWAYRLHCRKHSLGSVLRGVRWLFLEPSPSPCDTCGSWLSCVWPRLSLPPALRSLQGFVPTETSMKWALGEYGRLGEGHLKEHIQAGCTFVMCSYRTMGSLWFHMQG